MPILDSLRPERDLRVLVTAGASGVGAAIARAFHEAGSRVHVCDVDRSAIDRLHAVAPDITGSMADASVAADVDSVFDDVRSVLGGLDVLVNSAGIAGPAGPIDRIDGAAWERTIAVNLHSHYHFVRRAVPLLRRSGATHGVIAMCSPAGPPSDGSRSAGAAARWAVVGLVRSLALELGPEGIRINAILRGTTDEAGQPNASRRGTATADDVAALVLFLCSPAARMLTGQAISVDGDRGHP